jgi:hypothetical protein
MPDDNRGLGQVNQEEARQGSQPSAPSPLLFGFPRNDVIKGIVVVLVMMPFVWVCSQVYDMNARLREHDAKFTNIHEDLGAIKKTLPTVDISLARKRLAEGVEFAVVTMQPFASKAGARTTVHIWRTSQQRLATFSVPSEGTNDDVNRVLESLIADRKQKANTLDEIKRYTELVQSPISLPQYIDGSSSYVFSRDDPAFTAELAKLLNEQPRATKLATTADTPVDVMKALKVHRTSFLAASKE